MASFLRPRTCALGVALLLALACGGSSDERIVAQIDQQIASSPLLGDARVDVSSKGGVVTLSGVVANDAQRARVEGLAWGVEGVESVESRLQVSAAPPAVAAPPPAGAPPAAAPPAEAPPPPM